MFSGNQDRDSIVYHKLARQITARYIRFIPVEWQSHISMRVEIYGCAGTSRCRTISQCITGSSGRPHLKLISYQSRFKLIIDSDPRLPVQQIKDWLAHSSKLIEHPIRFFFFLSLFLFFFFILLLLLFS